MADADGSAYPTAPDGSPPVSTVDLPGVIAHDTPRPAGAFSVNHTGAASAARPRLQHRRVKAGAGSTAAYGGVS